MGCAHGLEMVSSAVEVTMFVDMVSELPACFKTTVAGRMRGLMGKMQRSLPIEAFFGDNMSIDHHRPLKNSCAPTWLIMVRQTCATGALLSCAKTLPPPSGASTNRHSYISAFNFTSFWTKSPRRDAGTTGPFGKLAEISYQTIPAARTITQRQLEMSAYCTRSGVA